MPLIECPECQAKISDQADSCIHCGFPLKKLESPTPRPPGLLDGNPNYTQPPRQERPGFLSGNPNYASPSNQDQGSYYQDRSQQQVVKSAKSRGVFIILGLFFGMLGIHNFYAGYFGRGIAQFLTVAILGWFLVGFAIVFVWCLVEFFVVTRDAAGDKLV